MAGFEVLRTYVCSYPRLTVVALIFNAIASVIGGWQYGAEGVVSAILAYSLMTLELKLILLLMLHEKLFAFPRQIAPAIVAIVLLAIASLAAAYPLLKAACAGC